MDNKKITITIPVEIYDSIKDQLKGDDLEISSYDDLIGNKFFFRTVTYHLVGKVTRVIGHILQLENASWIADSGRFMNAIKEGTLKEVEPVGTAFINLETCCDFFPWKHDLPNIQK
jgi:hypothetical protein